MKVQVSLKGRGKPIMKGGVIRKGRMRQGYFAKRGGCMFFYPYADSSLGPRIKQRRPKPKSKSPNSKKKY